MKAFYPLAGIFALATAGAAFADCPAGTTEVTAGVCKLQGTYTSDLTLSNRNQYLLSGGVFIGQDGGQTAVLSIQAGTTIKGESGRDYLVVNRGSRLEANASKASPIVFTSDRQVRGGWGGLVINGRAPINGCTSGVCEAEGEGSTGKYGGSDPSDNSGTLRFVRVEYAGFQITPDNELNGIAFQGVGSGTTVENVQVFMAADDGVEFFGGTVNVRNLVVVGARDDSIDWVNGWTGNVQYAVVKQLDDEANNGIEADNLQSDAAALPRSLPEISNLTLIGTTSGAAKGGDGIHLRRGSGLRLYNSIVTGFKNSCLNIDDAGTFNKDNLTMEATVLFCGKTFDEQPTDPFSISQWFLAGASNVVKNPNLNGAVSPQSQVLTTPVTPDNFFFEEVDFVGAIRSSAQDWTKGWTKGL
jgi:hypothetical protein